MRSGRMHSQNLFPWHMTMWFFILFTRGCRHHPLLQLPPTALSPDTSLPLRPELRACFLDALKTQEASFIICLTQPGNQKPFEYVQLQYAYVFLCAYMYAYYMSLCIIHTCMNSCTKTLILDLLSNYSNRYSVGTYSVLTYLRYYLTY